MNRKAQAAMESLLTYGWAIIGFLAVIALLWYFTGGVSVKLVPAHCGVDAPFVCVEHKVGKDGLVHLGIQNGAGWDMISTTINITCNEDASQSRSATFANVRSQERMNGTYVIFDCSPITDTQYKFGILITYTNDGDTTTHTSKGSVRAYVE